MSKGQFQKSPKIRIFELFKPDLEKPIFILSAPRSGSSYLYEILSSSPDVWALEKENDALWFRFFPYQRMNPITDWIGAKECTREISEDFRAQLLIKVLRQRKASRPNDLFHHFLSRKAVRYIEKTVANCFHLEALNKMFPDALYIHLVRDGRACISSMLEGWNSNFFWKRPIPNIPNATVPHWCYPFPPDWQRVISRPLVEICAWSWIEHNRYILEYLESNKSFRERYIRISYEDFIDNPHVLLKQVLAFVGLENTSECIQKLHEDSTSWTTISPPKKNKWKKNSELINTIQPLIKEMMQTFSYQI